MSFARTERNSPRPGRRWSIVRLLPRSLYGRSLLIIVMPLIVLQAVSTWVFYDRHWDLITRRLTGGLAGDVAFVIEEMQRAPEERAAILAALARSTDHWGEFKEGAVLPDGPPVSRSGFLDHHLARAMDERVGRPFRMDTRSFERVVMVEVQLPDGVLQISTRREIVFSSTTYVFLLWMAGSSLILFAVAGIFMRGQVKPLVRLAEAAEAFGKGRDIRDFRPAGATEIRGAAAAFLMMRNRIVRQMAQRTEMLAGVSHDLRTPLTRLKLGLALLARNDDVAELEQDVAEMERMLNGYLAFARGEGGEAAVPCDPVSILDDAVGAFARDGANVRLGAVERLELPLRAAAFRRCIDNLLSNAARHANRVCVSLRVAERAVEITVDDDGPGIAPDERENVFRPFYRVDASRNPSTGGVGLGLSIARDVIRSHGGELFLEESAWGGLRARIRLPR